MSNIKNPEEYPNFSMQRVTSPMKHKHIICPSCKGNSFKISVANLAQSRRLIMDCHDCQTRCSAWVKGWDKRDDKRTSWSNLEYSQKNDVIE